MKTVFALRKLGVVLAGGLALVAINDVAVAGSIKDTRHNLSTTSTWNKFTPSANADGSIPTSEICAFCHTPHGADTAAPAPLWNRSLGSKGADYQLYSALGTSTLDGAVAQVGSVSLACLSCHDGTQAMNTVINATGSGGYNSGGKAQAGSWEGPTAPGGNGTLTQAGIAYIGTDLRNDHPVGIQYGGGGFKSSDNLNKTAPTLANGSPVDSDFVTPYVKSNDKTAVFWVETGDASSGRQKSDLILYTRNEANITGGAQPFVECASCHDPHVSNDKADAPTGLNARLSAANGQPRNTFLRISNTASSLCLACHTK